MAWTAAQLASIESAIISLAGGAEEVEIGDKRFKRSSLSSLMALRDQMVAEVQAASDGGVGKISFGNKALL
jgi:hypothetical protein